MEHRAVYYVGLLFYAGILAWVLISGQVVGVYWSSKPVRRDDQPLRYWLSLASITVIFIVFLIVRRAWR